MNTLRLINFFLLFLIVIFSVVQFGVSKQVVDIEDNDFAEFEEAEDEGFEDEQTVKQSEVEDEEAAGFDQEVSDDEFEEQSESAATEADDEEATVEDLDDFSDDEEFEGAGYEKGKDKSQEPPKLTIANVPQHLRTHWDSFHMELLLLAGLLVYLLNFLSGRSRNQRLAQAWFSAHKELLENQFALVGDDGTSKEVESKGELSKESEATYRLWCSGRVCCEGMLVELKLLKRQDLVSVIAGYMKPRTDQLHVTVHLSPGQMDTFCVCVGPRRTVARLQKEMEDLSVLCGTERKTGAKYDLPESFAVATEVADAAAAVLDSKTVSFLRKHESHIDFIHFSDQYSGPRAQEESQTAQAPTTRPVLSFGFNLSADGKTGVPEMENSVEMMRFVLHCVERVRKIRLPAKSKLKCESNRRQVAERYQKQAHVARQETAQKHREEKRRREKQKIMDEKDPEKQRKLEEAQQKRDAKKQKPKMKMMKVKGM